MNIRLLEQVKNEYQKIDHKWLELHLKTSVGLFFFSVFIEAIISIIICTSPEMHVSVAHYVLKYLVAPILANGILILAGWLVFRSNMDDRIKIYIVSINFVLICFVLFTVHSVFSSLYFIFVVAIALTVVYSDYVLTLVTSALSIVLFAISELFLVWDPDKASIYEDTYTMAGFLIALFLLSGFTAVILVAISFQKKKNEAIVMLELDRYRLKKRLIQDDLTRVPNRKALKTALNVIENDRSYSKYIFAMTDIDHFKKINDTSGHGQGDLCLKEFGRILRSHETELQAFRYGGDEFCLIFRNKTIEHAKSICHDIQEELERLSIPGTDKFTVSFGLAEKEEGIPAQRLMELADRALYEAKINRNSVCIYKSSTICD